LTLLPSKDAFFPVVYEYLFENMDDAFYVLDTHGDFVAFNRKSEELTGYKCEDLIGKPYKTLVSGENLAEAEKAFIQVMKGKSSRFELNVNTVTGKTIPAELTVTPLILDEKIVGAFGIARDISERVLMEKTLKATSKKLETILETAMEGFTIVDAKENLTFINKAFADMLSYKQKDLLGVNLRNLVNKKSSEEIRKQTEVRKQGKISRYEVAFYRKDGKSCIAQVSAAPLWNEDGSFAGSVGVVMDITARKMVEEALRESEEKFRNIFEGANDAIVYGDLSGRVLGLNRKAEELAGMKRDEIVGKHFWKLKLVGLKDVPMLLSRLKSRMVDKPTAGFELVIKSKDDRKKSLEVTVSTLRKHRLPAGFLAIIRDITERKQMMTKLEEYSQRLELLVEERTRQLKEAQVQLLKTERLAAIGQVAAMVGHDLRNPLTGIAGAAYYLKIKLGSQIDEKSQRMLMLINRNIEYSNKIIADLLDYSREIRLEFSKVSIKSLLKEALSMIKIPVNINVSNSILDEAFLEVDAEKLQRVFLNIIRNAMDAMPKGGRFVIESSRQTNGFLEITFADTGVGMSKDLLEQIWTPFYSTKAKGLGLGLPICKRIIEAHGGNISAESMVGKGTTFRLTIPLKQRRDGGEKTWVKEPEYSLSTMTRA